MYSFFINIMAKQQADLWKYRDRSFGDDKKRKIYHYTIENIPPTLAKKILTGQTNINPKDRQNNSPTMGTLVSLAMKYHGFVGGYVIPVASKRDDARIILDTLYIPVALGIIINKLKNKTNPDEFDEVMIKGKTYMRFWWD